jgi:hypothetical protein
MRIQSIVPLIALSAVSAAFADTVFLANGGMLEGRVTYEDGRIVVEQASGKVFLDKSRVDHIEKGETALDEFDAKFAAVKAKGNDALAGDWAQVGRFAAEHNMRDRAEKCYFKALALDPDNAVARVALGFEKFQDRWMTSDEANQARGMVKHNGSWVTAEAKADLLKLEAAAQVERARAAAEGARADQERSRTERLDKELQLIEAQREANNVVVGGTVYVGAPHPAHLPAGPGTPGIPSAPVSAPAAANHPAPATSFSPPVVETPDSTVRLGTGGNIIVQPRR